MKLNSHQLRKSRVGESAKHKNSSTHHPLVLVLDQVLDTYNIGSFFRLAEALNVEKLCLCGPVVTPPNLKIHRASIGTWKWVNWQQYNSTIDCLRDLKKAGYQIVACEQGPKTVNYQQAKYQFPLAIIAGSESNGISKDVLSLCDQIIEIPMYGVNISLNVLVATAIISFDAVSKI
ncbi:MAG TPA: TrmH family RNA methyltransferase [Candidatus Woesebacteria bacterium]|nr:TrmH family RNA methyltransferase [Candidatus Woesebacteria bacterium]HPJ17171.1 TrmH family RNA methyltransferase [Candidatus Woesebacteria bacterium]